MSKKSTLYLHFRLSYVNPLFTPSHHCMYILVHFQLIPIYNRKRGDFGV
nr:MAG TPA: hypothetical protein [Caudoviricetes sp.]